MIRGTTPTLVLSLEGIQSLSGQRLYVTVRQTLEQITKTNDSLSISGTQISVYLTQDETLLLHPGTCRVQVRGINAAGSAWASDIAEFTITDVLKEGIIYYDHS